MRDETMVHVKMAGIGFTVGQGVLRTTLGSCVAVVIHDPQGRVSALAHIMLPAKVRQDDTIGKYADTAIPYLVSEIIKRGARRKSLTALLVGGASMFAQSEDTKITSIGTQNVAAAKLLLAELGIPIVHEEVGGFSGRTLVFENANGTIGVRSLS